MMSLHWDQCAGRLWTARHNTSKGRTQHKDIRLLFLCNVHDQLPSITLQETASSTSSGSARASAMAWEVPMCCDVLHQA